MSIYQMIGEKFPDPIKVNGAVGDLRRVWDTAQNHCLVGQSMRSESGKVLNYTLLYYTAGLTTWCAGGAATVLTGYMSGCFLFRYRQHGQIRFAHVGTDSVSKDLNDHAKASWKALTRSPGVTDIFGYDPLAEVSDIQLAIALKVGTPEIMGIWEPNGATRIGIVAKLRHEPEKRILVEVVHAPLQPWATLSAHRKFN